MLLQNQLKIAGNAMKERLNKIKSSLQYGAVGSLSHSFPYNPEQKWNKVIIEVDKMEIIT